MPLVGPGAISVGQALGISAGGTLGGASLLNGNTGVFALLGDSIEAQNNLASSTAGSEELSILSRGPISWLRIFDPRGRWDNWYDATVVGRLWTGQNQGFSGDQTSDVIARMSVIYGITGLTDLILGSTTNDINAAVALATIQTNFTTIIHNAFTNCPDLEVIHILTPPPRTLAQWASGSVARLKWVDVCNWMQTIANSGVTHAGSGTFYPASKFTITRRDLLLSNADADRTPITSPLAVLNADGVHPSPYGGYIIATDPAGLGVKLAARFNSFTDFPVYPVTGELFPNPTFTGTAGSKGAGVTGDIATSLNCSVAGTGVTVVGSKNADGSQRLVITSTGAGSINDLVRLGITSATIVGFPATGDWVRSAGRFKIFANSILQGACPLSRGQPSGSNMYSYGMKPDGGYRWPNVDIALSNGDPLWSICPPWQIRASTTGLIAQFYISVDGTQTGSATIDFHRFHLYPIANPKTSLGFS